MQDVTSMPRGVMAADQAQRPTSAAVKMTIKTIVVSHTNSSELVNTLPVRTRDTLAGRVECK
jgi:hypothetical protein